MNKHESKKKKVPCELLFEKNSNFIGIDNKKKKSVLVVCFLSSFSLKKGSRRNGIIKKKELIFFFFFFLSIGNIENKQIFFFSVRVDKRPNEVGDRY
jgi:hypothetical protein